MLHLLAWTLLDQVVFKGVEAVVWIIVTRLGQVGVRIYILLLHVLGTPGVLRLQVILLLFVFKHGLRALMLSGVVQKLGEVLLRIVHSISAEDARAWHRAERLTSKVIEVFVNCPGNCPSFQLRHALLVCVQVRSLITSPRL